MIYPKPVQNLIALFTKLPGIGPRQAARFSFFILKENNSFLQNLISALQEAGKKVSVCGQCFRTVERSDDAPLLCVFCKDSRREKTIIAVVEKESDMQELEKTSAYHGLYHVLGGVISPLDPESPKRLHLKTLHERVRTLLGTNPEVEVILATNSTTEGDTTALYLERILEPLKNQHQGLKISRLGRGLSLGSELEYADEVTLKNALTNRK
ncbi:MAG: recombination protein RecR [Candidatus Sungiibacteriota bacterium]|uniref:Recombination protein RecR n=1 Tax=Candidatus Sungiibacteriota bacterium TaxID=2750080 RepID=A0A7T5UQP2_9BACT|nr:MAG: recombination protein RecR [Candidatus Sungbacteria bacterium]